MILRPWKLAADIRPLVPRFSSTGSAVVASAWMGNISWHALPITGGALSAFSLCSCSYCMHGSAHERYKAPNSIEGKSYRDTLGCYLHRGRRIPPKCLDALPLANALRFSRVNSLHDAGRGRAGCLNLEPWRTKASGSVLTEEGRRIVNSRGDTPLLLRLIALPPSSFWRSPAPPQLITPTVFSCRVGVKSRRVQEARSPTVPSVH